MMTGCGDRGKGKDHRNKSVALLTKWVPCSKGGVLRVASQPGSAGCPCAVFVQGCDDFEAPSARSLKFPRTHCTVESSSFAHCEPLKNILHEPQMTK